MDKIPKPQSSRKQRRGMTKENLQSRPDPRYTCAPRHREHLYVEPSGEHTRVGQLALYRLQSHECQRVLTLRSDGLDRYEGERRVIARRSPHANNTRAVSGVTKRPRKTNG